MPTNSCFYLGHIKNVNEFTLCLQFGPCFSLPLNCLYIDDSNIQSLSIIHYMYTT